MPQSGAVRAVWMGTAGLFVSDGETSLYIDPFVSRYGFFTVGCRVPLHPKTALIAQWAARTSGNRADAVLVSHSHYDHAMDAPFFARFTGAMLVGSPSTANVARGAGLGENQILTVKNQDTVRFGRFEATYIQGIHSPAVLGRIPWPGVIRRPLVPPAPAASYREGGVYAILVKHPKGVFLHYGSPGIKTGMFDGIKADVVFLSLGGRKDTPSLIAHVLLPLNPATVIPIHFDDLFGPVSPKVRPLMGVNLKEFHAAMKSTPHVVRIWPVGEAKALFD